jgi:ankyrin repeat protein
LSGGASASARDARGTPMLLAALEKGRADIVGALLDAKASVNAESKDGESALVAMVRSGRVDMARLLLDRGADANAETRPDPDNVKAMGPFFRGRLSGEKVLLLAVKSGNVDMARLLLDHGAKADSTSEPKIAGKEALVYANAPEFSGESALTIAARSGNLEMARSLLDHGANPKEAGTPGHSAVEAAAFAGNTAIVDLMIAKAADPTERTALRTQADRALALGAGIRNDKRLSKVFDAKARKCLAPSFFEAAKVLDAPTNKGMAVASSDIGMMVMAAYTWHVPLAGGTAADFSMKCETITVDTNVIGGKAIGCDMTVGDVTLHGSP